VVAAPATAGLGMGLASCQMGAGKWRIGIGGGNRIGGGTIGFIVLWWLRRRYFVLQVGSGCGDRIGDITIGIPALWLSRRHYFVLICGKIDQQYLSRE